MPLTSKKLDEIAEPAQNSPAIQFVAIPCPQRFFSNLNSHEYSGYNDSTKHERERREMLIEKLRTPIQPQESKPEQTQQQLEERHQIQFG